MANEEFLRNSNEIFTGQLQLAGVVDYWRDIPGCKLFHRGCPMADAAAKRVGRLARRTYSDHCYYHYSSYESMVRDKIHRVSSPSTSDYIYYSSLSSRRPKD